MQNKLEKQRAELKGALLEWEKVVRGTLRKVYAPCGKKKCKCKQGALQGPYYYLAVTTKDKTKLYYLPKKQMHNPWLAFNFLKLMYYFLTMTTGLTEDLRFFYLL